MAESKDPIAKLENLTDALSKEIDLLSDEILLQETSEEEGGIEACVDRVQSTINSAIASHGKSRLARARQEYNTQISQESKVMTLPTEKKRELIAHFANSDREYQERLTLAARNSKDTDADLDTILEDLILLGAIDEDGNIP